MWGTSAVYLRLYLQEEGVSGQHMLLSRTANYGQAFPSDWTTDNVTLPATLAKHRLVLKGYTPYKEAYIAVKDIAVSGSPDFAEEENITEAVEESRNELVETEGLGKDENFQEYIQKEEGEEDLIVGFTRVVEPDLCGFG